MLTEEQLVHFETKPDCSAVFELARGYRKLRGALQDANAMIATLGDRVAQLSAERLELLADQVERQR